MSNLCAFKLFSIAHFVYLLLAIGITVGLFFALRKLSERTRFIVNISMFGALVFFIILEFVGRIILIKDFNFFDNLPIEYFQIFTVIMLITFIRQNIKWIKFGYLIVLPIAFFSLIFIPKFYCNYSSFSISLISFVFIHAILMSLSLLNVMWEECEISKKDILDANMTFIITASAMHIINILLRFTFLGVHANLGGTMGESYNLCIELLYHLISVPFVFMLPIFAIVVGLSFLLRIPFDMIQHKKQKQSEIEELIALGNLKKQQELRKQYSKTGSQIYIKSDTKAKPEGDKGVVNRTRTDFVAQNKEIKVNNETTEK